MKFIILSIAIVAAFFVGAVFATQSNNSISQQSQVTNVSIIDGKQIIEISAKGGYTPKVTLAKAGLPTVIKMDTRGTFDCSSALSIPSLGYTKNLPPSGETLIEVPPQKAGTTMQGLCSMGMYNFIINFN